MYRNKYIHMNSNFYSNQNCCYYPVLHFTLYQLYFCDELVCTDTKYTSHHAISVHQAAYYFDIANWEYCSNVDLEITGEKSAVRSFMRSCWKNILLRIKKEGDRRVIYMSVAELRLRACMGSSSTIMV